VLDDARLIRIRDTVAEVVDDLSDHDDSIPGNGITVDPEAAAAVEATNESDLRPYCASPARARWMKLSR
jgi:hypothetical protein